MKKSLSLLVLAGFILLMNACVKGVSSPPPKKKTYVNIMHMAPWSPAVEVYFNDLKVSQVVNPGVSSQLYEGFDPKTYAIKFKKASTDSLVASLPGEVYDSLKYYTLLLYNESQTSVKAFRIQDDYSNLTLTQAFIRFFHFSPNTGPVDLFIETAKASADRVYTDNLGNASYNAFTTQQPGGYNIAVKRSGTGETLATALNVVFQQGNAYTIYLSGLDGVIGVGGLSVRVIRAAQ